MLLYKEVELALGINSYYSKQTLTKLHPTNVKVHFTSFLRNDLIKWVEMPVRPSVNIFSSSISSLTTGPSILKFHILILEMGPHNRSGPDFAVS